MGTLSIRIPEYLHKSVRELAEQEGVSINHLITLAIAEKLSALTAEDYIAQRAARGSREKYEAVLAKVPDVQPMEADR